MHIAKYALPVDHESPWQLVQVAARKPPSTTQQCSQTSPPQRGSVDLRDGTLRNAECAIGPSTRIRQTREWEPQLLSKGCHLDGTSHGHHRHRPPHVDKLLVIVSHRDRVLTTKRSPQMPQEEQSGWLGRPDIGQGHRDVLLAENGDRGNRITWLRWMRGVCHG